jgi:hypothetical protein
MNNWPRIPNLVLALTLALVSTSAPAAADHCVVECQRWLPPWPCAQVEVWCDGGLWCTSGSCGDFRGTFVCWNEPDVGTWSGSLDCGYNPGWVAGQSASTHADQSGTAPHWRVVYRPSAGGAVAVVASAESSLRDLGPRDLELPADHDLKLTLCPGDPGAPPRGRLLRAAKLPVPKELGDGFLVAAVKQEGGRAHLEVLAGEATNGLTSALSTLQDRVAASSLAPEVNWLFARWKAGRLDLVAAIFAEPPAPAR